MTIYPTFDPTSLFAGGDDFEWREVTVKQAGQLTRGTLLGRITATDKYIASVAGAADGSQLAANLVILAEDVDTTAGDVVAPVYMQGTFAFEKMTVDASWSFATLDAALRAAASQIYLRTLGVLG